ncbi:nucleolin 2-like [Ischnura elegans]|uniref:nucleolin 2-like n=1 Tax=Ischnura elegans TaxID=197161 RepID=UPI001ED8AE19|nr:nucleolin 2-like [Ischnura elegans]
MGDVIQLSSGDEENKGTLAEEKPLLKDGNAHSTPGSKGVLKENMSTEIKKILSKCTPKNIGKKRVSKKSVDAEGESWSAFQNFIKICHDTEVQKRKGDPKLSSRICDKLCERFKKADPEYTKSEVFRDLLKSVGKSVENDPKNLFVHMREVNDQLHLRCVKQKNNNHKRKAEDGEDTDNVSVKRPKTAASDCSGDHSNEATMVNEGHCKKLEKLFEKVYRKVKQLEEKEVDWDDEENSNYIRLEAYKRRLWAIWEKWKEASGRSDDVKKLKHQKVAFSETSHPDLDRAIEKHVNKTKCFPDYLDIYKITSETLNKDKGFSEEEIKSIASTAFQKLGNQLQKRRVLDFWNCCFSYLPSGSDGSVSVSDPADDDAELAKALRENKEKYNKKISDVIDCFVVKQVDELHEPEEVVLNSDDEVSTHSGDEEESEEEDKPEDIICISSSSEEHSGGETDDDEKKPKKDVRKLRTNGVVVKKESSSSSDSDHTPNYIPLSVSSSKETPGFSGIVKKELVVKLERYPAPSTSGVQVKKSSSSDFSKENSGKNTEIVILSESDSSGE